MKQKFTAPKRLPRLIVAISGASGAIYGVRLLELLRGQPIETHLIVSEAARMTLAAETGRKIAEVESLATQAYRNRDVGAAIASGSYPSEGMIIAPCSVKTLGEIASGVTQTLISRAADVQLKERHRLVLMLRETPLHLGHIRNMAAVTEMGAIVAPPVPAFYGKPHTLEDMVDHTLGRVLDLYGIEVGTVRRWGERAGGTRGTRR